MKRVLILDEDPFVSRALAELLEADGHACVTCRGMDEALDRLRDAQAGVDLLITEMQLAGGEGLDGLSWLRRVRDEHPSVVPLVVTGYGKIEDAVRAIKLGAADYLTKPVLDDELRDAVRKAGELHALLSGVEGGGGSDAGPVDSELEDELGHDVRVAKAVSALEDVAVADVPVAIVGEAGTGRSRLAEALHARSPRRDGPCVTFTCRDDDNPRHLADLVGHVREAFPETPRRRGGAAGAARGGTLIVRELQAATPAVQAAIGEMLEHGRARPVGASEPRAVDTRPVFTVTEPGSADGARLEPELLHRAAAVRLDLPPLRARPDDIAMLARRGVKHASRSHGRRRRLGDEALRAMLAYGWPGNLTELRAACGHAVVFAATPEIGVSDLPSPVTRGPRGDAACPSADEPWVPRPLSEAMLEPERRILRQALEANGWNRSETARQLGIDRTTLYKKIRKFRLDEPG
ncbi:MAG: sigma 54-interacting transcriptional regulator [Planctomycetota bacterium]